MGERGDGGQPEDPASRRFELVTTKLIVYSDYI
jgi:hypothetical protein